MLPTGNPQFFPENKDFCLASYGTVANCHTNCHTEVVWDVAEREDQAIAADLMNRACLSERVSKSRQQPLILHADNGNAMRAATLERRLEDLGVLRSFSRHRVSNDSTTPSPSRCSARRRRSPAERFIPT